MVRIWLIVFLGNIAGTMATLFLCYSGGIHELADGGVGNTLLAIGSAKIELPWQHTILSGVLCNGLLCLAIWLSLACRTVVWIQNQ